MKQRFLYLSAIVVAALACGPMAGAPSAAMPTAATTPIPVVQTPTPVPAMATSAPSTAGKVISYGVLNLVVPPEVASGASGSDYPRVDGSDAAWWQKTPGHLQVTLDDYVLQEKTHQPQIYVYPAKDYAELLPAAFESMHRLNNLFVPELSISAEQLPAVPFFKAQQTFASNIQLISFQNGRGVRFLTEYAQYAAPANNQDLFYQFQGLTSDGAYYIVAILPIAAPVLAETSDSGAVLPSGGIAYPDMADPNADFPGYYRAVTDLLNATPTEAFVPTIDQLDLLIQSMHIAPQ